ncbi:MAG: hydrogen peroxide-inducible genes activator [Candidatus Binatia bacterium]|nr:hydrogen peroxide-inducible genes activator [Candidatus Binatia bacterium]
MAIVFFRFCPLAKTMDLTAVTLTELRYLVALADTGHFGRAAAKCFVTQPTLSTQLKKLENNLGVQLVERDPRCARLTAVGHQVVAHARVILEHVQAIGDVARGQSDPLSGEFHLGVIPTLGPYLLPQLLGPLQKKLPQLRLAVVEQLTAALVDELLAHRLDAALLALPVEEEGLEALELFEEPFWVLAPRRHPLARRKTVSEDELEHQPVLLLAEGHCLREQTLAVCGKSQPEATADFRASSLETLRHLVSAGYGCTLIPELAVPRLRDPGTVVRPLIGEHAFRRIGIVWRRSYPRAEAVVTLGHFIREQALRGGMGSMRSSAAPQPEAAPAAKQAR